MISKKSSCTLAAGLALTLGLTLAPSAVAAQPTSAYAATAHSAVASTLSAKAQAALAQLPADWPARVAAVDARFGASHTTWAAQTEGVIDGGDYVCGRTPVQDWLRTQLAGVSTESLTLLDDLAGFDLATYDALVFGQESKSNSFGLDGRYTNDLNRTMTGMKRFWDFDGSDIQLIPMNSSTYQSIDRMVRVYVEVYELDVETATLFAEVVQEVIASEPGLRGGDNPYFSFNAFAFDPAPEDVEQFPGLTKRIVMGDGVLAGLTAIGLQDKAAPLGVLAHEYGHQVQYANNLFESDLTGAEATRRTELMADAYGTYYLVHARGGALNAARTLDVTESFYNVGDCQFENPNHHGTPNQRIAASEFAVDVIDAASNQGSKLGALAFQAKFEAVLPKLVAPDAR